MKQKIIKLIKNKYFLVFIVVVFFIIGLFQKSPNLKKPEVIDISKTTTTEKTYQDQPQSSKTYYINKTDSKTAVNGYSWVNGLLIYSTPEGIFNARTNKEMLKVPIKEIMWSRNGHALILNNSAWNLLKPDGSLINLDQIPIKISQDGQYYFHNSDNSSFISYVNNPKEKISLRTLLNQVVTSLDDKYISGINNAGNLVFIDQKLIVSNEIKVPLNSQLLSVSPNGSLAAIGLRSQLHLIDNQAKQTSLEFSKDSKIYANWINNSELFVIESYNNQLGVRIDELWLVNNQGNRQYLASGRGVRNGLDNTQFIFPSTDNEAIPLIEFNGQLWLLSLKPNELPIYNNAGLSFYFLESKSDPHPELENNPTETNN